MKIHGVHHRTIRLGPDGRSVVVLDQTKLPHEVAWLTVDSSAAMEHAIRCMQVRGAPLIGAAAAYGLALALTEDSSDDGLGRAAQRLLATRPTAVNLRWALDEVRRAVAGLPPSARVDAAYAAAAQVCDDDVATCRRIGEHGLGLLRALAAKKAPGAALNVLTHCNAGWLACVDWGTATSALYQAHDAGLPIHVWVDETRPRNQGASLTAFELGAHGVPHTLVVDNAGGLLMQHGQVDVCIVGSDRTTATGDVANKIGTYLKALAAKDNGVPFYVALPHSTLDWSLTDGAAIPIEERAEDEVLALSGLGPDGRVTSVRLSAPGTRAANPGFDVTPARLVTGLITERGVAPASREGLLTLYPERRGAHVQ